MVKSVKSQFSAQNDQGPWFFAADFQVALAQNQQLQVLPPLAPAFQEPSQALEACHFRVSQIGCTPIAGWFISWKVVNILI
jgi:hypothetical protein